MTRHTPRHARHRPTAWARLRAALTRPTPVEPTDTRPPVAWEPAAAPVTPAPAAPPRDVWSGTRDTDRPDAWGATMSGHGRCCCCGRFGAWPTVRVDGGWMHFDCWDGHHSDPTGPWPTGHVCAVDR